MKSFGPKSGAFTNTKGAHHHNNNFIFKKKFSSSFFFQFYILTITVVSIINITTI